jgi:hypothetical protein
VVDAELGAPNCMRKAYRLQRSGQPAAFTPGIGSSCLALHEARGRPSARYGVGAFPCFYSRTSPPPAALGVRRGVTS